MKCATCTEKPIDAAEVILPNNHVVDSTNPIEADGPAPKCPTMEASMKNINTLVICANIDGILNETMRFILSAVVNGFPLRIASSSMSLFFCLAISLLQMQNDVFALNSHKVLS